MKKCLLTLLIHLVSLSSFCQNRNLDSLNNLLIHHPAKDTIRVNLLNELSFHIFKNTPEKSLRYANEALTLSRELAFSKGELQAQNNLAVYYLMKGKSETALQAAMEATQIGESLHSTELLADSYSIVATVYQNQKAFDKAIQYINQALALKPAAVVVSSRIYNSLGRIACDKKNYDSAFIYYAKAIQVMREVRNNYRMPEVLNNIGIIYLRKRKLDSALVYFNRSSQLAIETQNRRAQVLAAINVGNVLIEKKKYRAAEVIETSALTVAREMGDQEKLMQINLSLATIKMETGKYHEAHVFMTEHYNIKDRLLNEEKNRQIAEIETRYETQKKDNTIRVLEQQSEIQSLRLWVLLISLLALMVSVVIIHFLQRKYNMRVMKLLSVQKILNQKLQENDQLKSAFFTHISHEFRTPLSLILAPIESKLSSPLKEEDRESFQLVRRNANRLLTLVNQLLDLSKLEAKKMELVLHQDDLKKFLSISATSFDSLAESREILFKKNIQLELSVMWFDADKLEKIINNILFNAFKFTPRGGTITYAVALTENNNDLVISITDTGIGIPENEQHYIFSPFYQSRYDVDNGQQGTGLGLSLVKELVKLYTGEINLISIVNQGTTITVTLPLTLERLPSTARFAETKKEAGSKLPETENYYEEVISMDESGSENSKEMKSQQDTILIVEDNNELRNFISCRLQDRFTIFTATDGKEGFAIASEYIPDLIISDVMMPYMNGLELSDKIKNDERTSHIPVVLLTARADLDSRIIGLQKGADDYLAKPFSMEELIVRVTNLIEQRKQLAKKYKAVLADPVTQKELSLDEKFILRARKIVEEHISDTSFGVEQMAENINLSRAQLFRKLKAITGISPNEFINEIRLKRAAQLILLKADTIAQIGYSVGFNEQSYFAKSFRKKFGVSPSEYTKKENVSETQICL